MPTQLFHEELRVLSAQVLSRRRPSGPPRLENCAVSTEFQDLNALAVAVELIEMRYQEHSALEPGSLVRQRGNGLPVTSWLCV
jgi:hypothetical protein